MNAVVLAEFVWTLRARLQIPRRRLIADFRLILDAPEFVVASPRGVARAVDAIPQRPADFADYVLAEINTFRRLRGDRDLRQRRGQIRAPFRSVPILPSPPAVSLPMPLLQRPPADLPAPRALRRNVRPHDRRPNPPRRHRARDRGREGFHHLRRGGEVRRRQGDPRRHGTGADDPRAGRRRHRHHQRRHPRSLGDRQSRRRLEGRAHRGDRQGRQSRHPARRHHRRRAGDRSDRGRRQDPHRRRLRLAHPFHLPAADRGGADVRRHLDAGRRHRPRDRHLRHHLHARPLAHPAHDRGRGRVSHEPRLRRQGQRVQARRARRAGQGRRLRAQIARGLGHDAGGDRLLPLASPTITTCR